ncbi:MAG: hypothetical protein KME21_20175 [Desmonostoc vinosum HA7617-LM4]|jgi:hypothetical protein|nr:hypothetical protein [Desmonostoc vinosum HA7617-LM4]
MTTQIIERDALIELSTAEQEVLSGGYGGCRKKYDFCVYHHHHHTSDKCNGDGCKKDYFGKNSEE